MTSNTTLTLVMPHSYLLVLLLVGAVNADFKCPSICNCSAVEKNGNHQEVDKVVDCSSINLLTAERMQKDKVMSRWKEGDVEVKVAEPDWYFLNMSHSPLEQNVFKSVYLLPFSEVYLQSIDMCCSEVTTVEPDAFKYAGEVGSLNLSYNRLSEISFVAGLKKLVKLDVSYNRIAAISVMDVRELDDLQVLNLQGNKLDSLSFMLMTLPSLVSLDVSDNYLKILPMRMFNNKSALTTLNFADNKIKMLSYCLMVPLLSNSSSLQLVNLTDNPLVCGCHMVWILSTNAEVIHSICSLPSDWRTTADVTKHCSFNITLTCGSSNVTHEINWDPYATLAKGLTGAGKVKNTPSTTGPKQYPEAKITQIFVLVFMGCVAVIVIAVAIVKNKRLLRGKLDFSLNNRSPTSHSSVDDFADPQQVELRELEIRNSLPGTSSWGNVQPGHTRGQEKPSASGNTKRTIQTTSSL